MKAIFVMSCPFPYGQAFSSRARNLTKLLCTCGYHVHVIALESKGKAKSDELSGYDYSVKYVHDPQSVVTLSGIGTARPYMEAVNEYLKNNRVDLIVSSSMVFVADQLAATAKKAAVPYLVEQCEWYDASTFKFGKYNPYYKEHIRRIEFKNKKVDGIIAISRLFEQYYSFQGVPVIRIPTILDVKNTEYRIKRDCTREYRIAFAGNIGKGKERMNPVFQALAKVNEKKKNMFFDIYGPSENEILGNINNDMELWKKVKPFIMLHGYIPQNEVENVVRAADFTIFTRPLRRSSNAGFPTKFAESMAVGTPVITNDTGDISLYLRDGENGFLVESDSDVSNVFERIIAGDDGNYERMRSNARKTAEDYFEFSLYVEEIKELLRKCKSRKG